MSRYRPAAPNELAALRGLTEAELKGEWGSPNTHIQRLFEYLVEHSEPGQHAARSPEILKTVLGLPDDRKLRHLLGELNAAVQRYFGPGGAGEMLPVAFGIVFPPSGRPSQRHILQRYRVVFRPNRPAGWARQALLGPLLDAREVIVVRSQRLQFFDFRTSSLFSDERVSHRFALEAESDDPDVVALQRRYRNGEVGARDVQPSGEEIRLAQGFAKILNKHGVSVQEKTALEFPLSVWPAQCPLIVIGNAYTNPAIAGIQRNRQLDRAPRDAAQAPNYEVDIRVTAVINPASGGQTALIFESYHPCGFQALDRLLDDDSSFEFLCRELLDEQRGFQEEFQFILTVVINYWHEIAGDGDPRLSITRDLPQFTRPQAREGWIRPEPQAGGDLLTSGI